MKYLVCNLKNKMDYEDFLKYNLEIENIDNQGIKLIFSFSNLYLLSVNKGNFDLASQDISSLIDETVTGELTGHQLASCGIKYVLVGHSERRIWKKEINIDFINKITEAQNNNLNIIYCIGETLKEKEENKTEQVLLKQIEEVLNNVTLNNLIIAYEPVWAIGSGITPSKEEVDKNINFIKRIVRERYELDFPVLYGGSLNPSNIDNYKNINGLNGFLVGGASLDAKNVQEMLIKMHKN